MNIEKLLKSDMPLCEIEAKLGISGVVRDAGDYFSRESAEEFNTKFKNTYDKVTRIILRYKK